MRNPLSDVESVVQVFTNSKMLNGRLCACVEHSLERRRLRVADLGVAGGGRPDCVPATAAAADRMVEKYRPEPSLTGLRMGGGV